MVYYAQLSAEIDHWTFSTNHYHLCSRSNLSVNRWQSLYEPAARERQDHTYFIQYITLVLHTNWQIHTSLRESKPCPIHGIVACQDPRTALDLHEMEQNAVNTKYSSDPGLLCFDQGSLPLFRDGAMHTGTYNRHRPHLCKGKVDGRQHIELNRLHFDFWPTALLHNCNMQHSFSESKPLTSNSKHIAKRDYNDQYVDHTPLALLKESQWVGLLVRVRQKRCGSI